MVDKNINMEDILIEKESIREKLNRFEPEVQEIFMNRYGTELENMPMDFGGGIGMEQSMDYLDGLRNSEHQKMILMRVGIVTGTPMTLEEITEYFGITKERARQIEVRFFRHHIRPKRRKKLIDYLED